MYVYRLHIRPKGGSASPSQTFEYCIENGILGVGWRLPDQVERASWQEYERIATPLYNNINVCRYIKKWVAESDLIWTRDTSGHYYLAKVISGWEYWNPEAASSQGIDVGNIVRADIKRVQDLSMVPGGVISSFRASRTIQEIASPTNAEFSKHVWNTINGTAEYKINLGSLSFFDLLDDEETEDLVFLFLQTQNWYVVPNSRKKDTMRYEFYAINRDSHQRAIVQVKTGDSAIDQTAFSNYTEKTFLFQSRTRYFGATPPNVFQIEPSNLIQLVKTAVDWLPSHIVEKARMSGLLRDVANGQRDQVDKSAFEK